MNPRLMKKLYDLPLKSLKPNSFGLMFRSENRLGQFDLLWKYICGKLYGQLFKYDFEKKMKIFRSLFMILSLKIKS